MVVPGVPDSALIVAGLGAFVAGVQLYMRFSEGRPFSTSAKTAALFIAICLISGAVAGSISLLPPPATAAVLGLGATVPFAARNPGETGYLRARSGSKPGKETGTGALAALDAIWAVTGVMANALDRRLSDAKTRKVDRVCSQIGALATPEDDIPIFERVYHVLSQYVEYLTGDDKQIRQGELRRAYEKARTAQYPLVPLMSLAYDLGREGLILSIVKKSLQQPPGSALP